MPMSMAWPSPEAGEAVGTTLPPLAPLPSADLARTFAALPVELLVDLLVVALAMGDLGVVVLGDDTTMWLRRRPGVAGIEGADGVEGCGPDDWVTPGAARDRRGGHARPRAAAGAVVALEGGARLGPGARGV